MNRFARLIRFSYGVQYLRQTQRAFQCNYSPRQVKDSLGQFDVFRGGIGIRETTGCGQAAYFYAAFFGLPYDIFHFFRAKPRFYAVLMPFAQAGLYAVIVNTNCQALQIVPSTHLLNFRLPLPQIHPARSPCDNPCRLFPFLFSL